MKIKIITAKRTKHKCKVCVMTSGGSRPHTFPAYSGYPADYLIDGDGFCYHHAQMLPDEDQAQLEILCDLAGILSPRARRQKDKDLVESLRTFRR